MKFDLSKIEEYINQKLISKQRHPTFDIWIYNYTPECVFSQKWDEITTQCRGLILDEEGTVIALPFKKFFNFDEPNVSIPSGTPSILKKMDGSLIIVTMYKGELIVATRGSFVSDQVLLARDMILSNLNFLSAIKEHYNRFTWLFELIGPDNRIVVSYPKNELVLLSIVDNLLQVEIGRDLLKVTYSNTLHIVEEYKAEWNENTLIYLQSLNINNEEGFVLKWGDGYRIKVKFSDYIELHRIITGLNEKTIWEYLRDGKDINELTQKVPEEFKMWVENTSFRLCKKFNSIYITCYYFIEDFNLRNIIRKEAALLIMNKLSNFQAVLFSMLDKKDENVRQNIYKIIKPKCNRYFKNIEEEL